MWESKCQKDWLTNVSMMPKLKSYVMFKNIFKSESYFQDGSFKNVSLYIRTVEARYFTIKN